MVCGGIIQIQFGKLKTFPSFYNFKNNNFKNNNFIFDELFRQLYFFFVLYIYKWLTPEDTVHVHTVDHTLLPRHAQELLLVANHLLKLPHSLELLPRLLLKLKLPLSLNHLRELLLLQDQLLLPLQKADNKLFN